MRVLVSLLVFHLSLSPLCAVGPHVCGEVATAISQGTIKDWETLPEEAREKLLLGILKFHADTGALAKTPAEYLWNATTFVARAEFLTPAEKDRMYFGLLKQLVKAQPWFFFRYDFEGGGLYTGGNFARWVRNDGVILTARVPFMPEPFQTDGLTPSQTRFLKELPWEVVPVPRVP